MELTRIQPEPNVYYFLWRAVDLDTRPTKDILIREAGGPKQCVALGDQAITSALVYMGYAMRRGPGFVTTSFVSGPGTSDEKAMREAGVW
jgi:hypothetical protein